MASKVMASAALLVALNLLFFSMVSSTKCLPSSKPKIPTIPTTRPAYPPGIKYPSCPRDTLKLGACANVLGGLVNAVIGTPPKSPCCSLLQGLADVEAAACLCTAIKANILGINLDVPVSLSLLLNYCGKKVPAGFQCA